MRSSLRFRWPLRDVFPARRTTRRIPPCDFHRGRHTRPRSPASHEDPCSAVSSRWDRQRLSPGHPDPWRSSGNRMRCGGRRRPFPCPRRRIHRASARTPPCPPNAAPAMISRQPASRAHPCRQASPPPPPAHTIPCIPPRSRRSSPASMPPTANAFFSPPADDQGSPSKARAPRPSSRRHEAARLPHNPPPRWESLHPEVSRAER